MINTQQARAVCDPGWLVTYVRLWIRYQPLHRGISGTSLADVIMRSPTHPDVPDEHTC